MIRKLLIAGAALLVLTGLAPPSNGASEQIVIIKDQRLPMTVGEQSQVTTVYGLTSITEQCAAQPSVLWCNRNPLPEKTLDAYGIVQLSLEVKDKFHYTSDKVDNWRVHSSEVLLGQDWYGDCDDLASTTLDILIRAGQPRNRVWLVLADVQHNGPFDHLVAMVQDVDGHFWIVGDTSAQNAYPADRIKYRIAGTARGDHMNVWEAPSTSGAFPISKYLVE